ncbi:hypothetical protein [Glycomyces sp. NRRL B-16210]|uniref:hypothetical protein n=1 Tax=Glycomyces sp. NRRL B-16210 TaxID=1463821 RepID=UPI0004C17E31|nr:hypothetical protein [Glycomyces sp. NRRL B-16210]
MPSAVPEDDSASDQLPPPPAPAGPSLYGETAQAPGPYTELDPEARRDEWAADLGGPSPEVPRQQAGSQEPPGPQDQGPQGEWGESPDWPPKSSQDWMSQQSQTGWGLANGGATWPVPSPMPTQPGPEASPAAAPAPQPNVEPSPAEGGPFAAPPEGGAPNRPAPEQQGGLEFPELRADPYEADLYGQAQYRGDSGGQDLYQSDPYQAERLQAETQQAAQAPQAPPFPPAPQPGSYGEQPSGQFDADPFGGALQEAPPQARPPQPEPRVQDQQSYGDQPFDGRPGGIETPATEAVPAQRRPEEAPAPEAPAETSPRETRVSPPTHRGVRYAFYGIGGLITLGLIIGIVLMLGASPPSEPSQQGGDTDNDGPNEDPAVDGALTAEQYSELAAAAGSDAWFAWRYGDASGGSDAGELPQVEGDALATAPLLGEADRSIQGQVGYLTEESGLSGIDHVTVVESTDDRIGLDPRAGGRFSEQGAPELELEEGATADCVAGLGGDLGRPVALARPEQSAEIDAHSVIAFSSGIVATTGISGAQGGTCLQLPDGQVPTDVALTDGNELALVTTWSPDTQTGSLVVIALADTSGSYQSSWSESYPGLPNPGHFATALIVGTVELPFGSPTSVDAWSNSGGSLGLGRGVIEGDAHRDTVATAAYAIVGDLSSSQVAVVDLASTLAGLAEQHYDGVQFTFDATAGEAMVLPGGVADVAATEGSSAVATRDGVVHELDGDLNETAATDVGANPTCLVVGAQSGAYIATSRSEATISWVSGGTVAKELADARLSDPLCASEAPALDVKGYSGTAAVVLVSDFEGGKLHAYLDGQATIPGGATVGGEGFSYGGAYEVAGKPWDASVTVDLD